MTFRYEKRITRQMLRDNPNTLFVFGDNMKRRGMGGQAAEMRGEPNAVGIPTKMEPSMSEDAFFTDEDFVAFAAAAKPDVLRLISHANDGGDIVWPEDGIGTGRAQLKERAPYIFAAIDTWRIMLETIGSGLATAQL